MNPRPDAEAPPRDASPETRRAIERALFDTAADLREPSLRDAFLRQACGADAALLARLRGLLRAHETAETFFPPHPRLPDAPAPSAGRPPPPAEAPADGAAAPERIGRYTLSRRLGEGGCGVVFLAEQDGPVRRQVALKIIRLGMDTERVVARFALERQTLALMNHPNVAQVLDGGATETGRPYFVMELVEGERITDYCRAHRLGIRERLALFIQVCHAIQHAHQKGILHRDIKPSNVLVALRDGAAVPKVIDFGVAKAVSGPEHGDASRTGDGFLIGTPAYMSPEQAEPGRVDVDTRSDIYSLGALLYELLTGRPPFDSRALLDSGLEGLRRTLREKEPARPSRLLRSLPPEELARLAAERRCTPSELVTTLRRDLDWVVLRALEKDRARRYPTVNALAFDLGRHLRDEPLEARPGGRLHRLRKLVRRNRVVFSAGLAVALALVGGLGASTWLYFRERAALREQTVLRHQAEVAGRLTRAAFLTREGSFALAARLLDDLQAPIATPSLDGVVAYRAVGDWLARQRRWQEAADRFAVALELGRLDVWAPVTLDHQSYGVALLLAGDEAAYQAFRRQSTERFSPATNSDAVARVLNTCLLRPLDAELRAQLLPLGARTDFWFSSLSPRLATGWASLPVSLWHYRLGDFDDARRLALAGDDPADRDGARVSTLRLLVALCDWQQGRRDEARARLARLHPVIESGFGGDFARGDNREGFWYDWAFVRLLLDEAEQSISAAPKSAK